MTMTSKDKPLPIINPTDLNQAMVDTGLQQVGYGHVVGDFCFTDQNNQLFCRTNVGKKVVVAEYFFTTCQSICPIMNRQMARIQKAYQNTKQLELLSFTVDPKNDTVAQLKRYAKKVGADDRMWHFLTGEKQALYDFARKSLFVLKPAEVTNQGDAANDFIHTNNFVLIDQSFRIRGYYDGTSYKEVNQLIADIRKLIENKH